MISMIRIPVEIMLDTAMWKGEEYNDVIACDNKQHPIGCFHNSYLRKSYSYVACYTQGKYYCPEYHNKRSKKKI